MYFQKIISKISQCVLLAFVFYLSFSIASVIGLPWKNVDQGLQAANAATLVAKNPRLTTSPNRTIYSVDISKVTKVRIVTLSNPYRVLVDLWDYRFERSDRAERDGQGLVLAFRHGQLAARVARIILLTKEPVRVEVAFLRASDKRKRPRLEVRLTGTDHASFIAGKTYLAPPVFAQEKVTQGGDGKPIIVIDPGHGGRDPGAIGARGTLEKTIVFAFSQALKRKLDGSRRYQVHMTREGDGFLKLPWRIFSARQLVRSQAARSLFISIHADSVPSGFSRSARGASVYVYSEEPSDRETMLRAINENQKTDGAKVESQMTRQRASGHKINGSERQRRHRSTLFAKGLLGELGGTTDLRWKHPRSANFTVLAIPDVPAVLIELGYISNMLEEKLLGSEPWREDMAAAVSRAIDAYFLKIGALNPDAEQADRGATNQ